MRPNDLAFRGADNTIGTEPGDYDVYVGDDATATASAAFTLAGP